MFGERSGFKVLPNRSVPFDLPRKCQFIFQGRSWFFSLKHDMAVCGATCHGQRTRLRLLLLQAYFTRATYEKHEEITFRR